MKKAVVTGAGGQVGSYLCELLLQKGYKVYGLKRRSSNFNSQRIDHLYQDPHINNQLELIYGDLSDYSSIANLVGDIKPDYFYNLAAMSHVRVSFEIPEYTMDVTGTGVTRCLEAIRKFSPQTRFLTSSSSEVFGSTPPPQNELTRFAPCSPYGVAKAAGYYATVNYREAYKLFAVNSICFNMESERRSETFVTRKIVKAATRIKLGLQDKLYLGNLEAKRDWQHAKDGARAMIMILEDDIPDDYVIASGEMHSVKEFLQIVFDKLSLNWKEHVIIEDKYFRPKEVDALQGDATKFKNKFDWKPEYNFDNLIDEMISADLLLAEKEKFMLTFFKVFKG